MQFFKNFMILHLMISSAFVIAKNDTQDKIVVKADDSLAKEEPFFIECYGKKMKVLNPNTTCKEVALMYMIGKKNKEKMQQKNEVVENSTKNEQVD